MRDAFHFFDRGANPGAPDQGLLDHLAGQLIEIGGRRVPGEIVAERIDIGRLGGRMIANGC
jgi:hypothetical protein